MSRAGAAALGVALLCGCAYYNTLYNSERVFEEAEAHRRAGDDSLAAARYRDVIRKTADAYRGRPQGEEAAATLFLLGRAQLRVGQAREAHAALTRAAELARDPVLRAAVLVHLGFASARLGESAEALAHLDSAFDTGLAGPGLAEAYLLRGRLLLQAGDAEGWDDLERAAASDPSVAVDAGIERLRWGVRQRNLERARSALARLLLDTDAAQRTDTISALVGAAAEQWSASVAATLLGNVDQAVWDRTSRSRLGLRRAGLLWQAGDTTGAQEQAWAVARGRGETVVEARLLLAQWRLDAARDLGDVQSVIPILLPVAEDEGARELLEAVDDLERYSAVGLDDPLGWFAAAEVARDRLRAPVLARGLFLAYADTDPTDRWAPKALLGALGVALDEEDRSWLRGRLEAHRSSPYVQAATGRRAGGVENLEEELRVRLSEIAAR